MRTHDMCYHLLQKDPEKWSKNFQKSKLIMDILAVKDKKISIINVVEDIVDSGYVETHIYEDIETYVRFLDNPIEIL